MSLWKIKVTSEKRIMTTLASGDWSQKSHFCEKILLEHPGVFKAVSWLPMIEEIHTVSIFMVTVEHLCTAVQYRLLRVAYCPWILQLVTAQTWHCWFKLALNCNTPASGLFCLLLECNKRLPFLACPSSFFIHCTQPLLFSISRERQRVFWQCQQERK